MAQQLTELQEKWLQALESGEYSQCQGVLHDGKGYCCLGVACVVAGLEAREAATGFMFLDKSQSLPYSVVGAMKLRESEGKIDGGPVAIGRAGVVAEYLTYANDNGATFAELAAFIRANPEKVFLPPEAQS